MISTKYIFLIPNCSHFTTNHQTQRSTMKTSKRKCFSILSLCLLRSLDLKFHSVFHWCDFQIWRVHFKYVKNYPVHVSLRVLCCRIVLQGMWYRYRRQWDTVTFHHKLKTKIINFFFLIGNTCIFQNLKYSVWPRCALSAFQTLLVSVNGRRSLFIYWLYHVLIFCHGLWAELLYAKFTCYVG